MMTAYTDGACSGNPGPGGWGVLMIIDGQETELCGGEAETTNNRMELKAAIEALRALPKNGAVKIVTDSTYVKDGITSWMGNWKRNDEILSLIIEGLSFLKISRFYGFTDSQIHIAKFFFEFIQHVSALFLPRPQ